MRSALPASALVSAGGEGAALTLAGARRALVEATQLRAVAGLVDRFAIFRHAAKKARLSLDQQNDWAVLKLEAERKAGQILGELRETGRLRDGRPNDNDASAFGGPLAELGISAIQSSRWQRVALLSEADFGEWTAAVRDAGEEITEAGLLTVAARMAAERTAARYVNNGAWNSGPARDGISSESRADCDGVPLNTLLVGDCLELLPTLASAAVEAIITDPPWAINVQALPGSEPWDRFSAHGYQDWCRRWGAELLRVAKPGALALVFGGTRTWHRLGVGLEDAGWTMRDCLMWAWGTSLPKSVDVGRDAGPAWAGYGTALRPAWSPILLLRKPSPLPTGETALGYGTGTLRVRGVGNRWPTNLWLDEEAADLVDRATGRPVSRLFYVPKPSRDEREAGLEGLVPQEWASAAAIPQRRNRPNTPSQNPVAALKPVALLRSLVRLIVPPGALVLDPFAGSGTLGLAVQAEGEGRGWLLIERDPQTAEVARARLGLRRPWSPSLPVG